MDILVLPFFGQGHINPCVELCKRLSSCHCKAILIIPSHLSSSVPPDFNHHPSVEVLQIQASYSPLPPPPHKPETVDPLDVAQVGIRPGNGSESKPVHPHHRELGQGIEAFLSERYNNGPGWTRPGCVVMDVMMSWSKEIFSREKIPVVSLSTSGACGTAMEYAAWRVNVNDMQPGETRILPGLPESMALSYADLKRRDHRQRGSKSGRHGPLEEMNSGPHLPGEKPPIGMNFGPQRPGEKPRLFDDLNGLDALLINTCDDLEGPFHEYLSGQIDKPVFSVGPLLPEKYWKSSCSILHDRDSRVNRESNYTEDEVVHWLDAKPDQSVIYVSFGSEVGPTIDGYAQLAEALEESNRPFIWVIQPGAGKPGPPANFFGGSGEPNSKPKEEGYYPHGLEEKVGKRGIVIKGWAPQLLILSHPSTGGFISHCGWNSTIEAIGRGVPILAWPIRGDQFYNAMLLVKYLKVGYMVAGGEELAQMVKKSDIVKGIEGLMGDGEVYKRAINLKGIFDNGYPSSSSASLKAFMDLIRKQPSHSN